MDRPRGVRRLEIKPIIFFAAFFGLTAEGVNPPAPEDIIRFAMTQGGLFALCLLLAWSYRRDLLRLNEGKDERIAILTEMIRASTEAQTKTSDALAHSTAALARLEAAFAGRRGRESS